MANNLGADLAKTTVVDRYELVPDWGPIEFLLVDGGGEGQADGSLAPKHVASQNALYVSNLASRAVVFVENKRPNQRAIYEREMGRPWVYAHYRSWDDKPGFHVYQLDPTWSDRLRLGGRNLWDRSWHGRGIGRKVARTYRRLRRRLGR